jgi:uncharacterized protein YrzB (UPF0473 family)
MDTNEETFLITVAINQGLEPTTFAVTAEEDSEMTSGHEMIFKLSREKDKDTLAALTPDTDHCWQQIQGVFDQEEIDAIGAAIDAHYA